MENYENPVNTSPVNEYNFALRLACEQGKKRLVEALLAEGVNVHAKNDEALRYASENGHIEVVKVLLSYGANVRARNDEALIIASQGDHRDVVKLLLEQYINNSFAV